MKSRFLLNVIVAESSTIFKLLSSKDESLLIGGDAFLVLNLSLDIVNGVRWFNIKSDGLSSEGLDEDLHTTSQSKNQVKSRFFLNIVVTEGSSIFQLLASEDKSLLIGGDTFFILNLSLDVINSVRWFNIKSDGLSSEGLDEDLHTSSESEDQMESGFLLDVIIAEGSAIFQLFASKDESLLIGGDTFLVLDLSLDVVNSVRWFDVQGDGLASKSLNEDLHSTSKSEDQMESWLFLDVVVREGSSVFELLSSEDESLLIGRDTFFVLDLGLNVVDGVRWFNV
jgi:hypothetical protein